jgi:hypothetical protein
MTKRKDPADLVRSKDLTIEQFIKAVGTIMLREGLSGVNPASVARETGRSRNHVNIRFGNINGLIMAYVARKDYWVLFFQRFTLSPASTPLEMKAMFTELMQENLNYFWNDAKAQRLILAQIGLDKVKRPLMRAISEEREKEGAALLALTDKYFAGTGVDFKMLMAMTLGGIYYLVLHAKNNGSTVAGRDLNLERDRLSLQRSIGQYIDWAWAHARPEDTEEITTPNMDYEFEALETLALERAAELEHDSSISTVDPKIAAEVKRLTKLVKRHLTGMQSEAQIRTYLQINLHTLVMVCNVLTLSGREQHEDAELVIGLLEGIRRDMTGRDYIPGNLALPRLILQRESPGFISRWETVCAGLKAAGISEELLEVAGCPFRKFASGEEVKWERYLHLRRYARGLEELIADETLTEDALMLALIGLGLNSIRLENHYLGELAKKLKGKDQAGQLAELKLQRALIRQHEQDSTLRYSRYRDPIGQLLQRWIDAEESRL